MTPKYYYMMVVFIVALISVTLRFLPWMPHVFAGDDLSNFLAFKDGQFASSLHQALTNSFYQKYRPVFAIMIYGLFTLFDKNLTDYFFISVLLQAVNTVLVYLIALKLNRHWQIAFIIAFIAGVSRFAIYQVVQLTGLVEALGMVFFLLTVYFFLCADKNKNQSGDWILCSIITAFLALNTHERYVVLFPWLIGAIILQPLIKPSILIKKIGLVSFAVTALLVNIIYKKILAGIPFFVGTGGSLIIINMKSIIKIGMEAILTLFGFNKGSEDQIGIKFTHLDWMPSKLLVLIFALGIIWVIAWGMSIALKNNSTTNSYWQKLYWPILLIALIIFLLLPPMMTTHLEQRWLLEPYILLLLLFAWALNYISDYSDVLALRLAIVVGISAFLLDTIIIKNYDQLFFMQSTDFGYRVKQDIIDKNPQEKTPIVFITWKANCDWSLAGGDFFRIYGGLHRTIYCFKNYNEYLENSLPKNIPVYQIKQGHLSLLI